MDEDGLEARLEEPNGNGLQVVWTDAQDDCVGSGGEIAGTGLAGCVCDLGCKESEGEVVSNDDVVGLRGPLTVNACS